LVFPFYSRCADAKSRDINAAFFQNAAAGAANGHKRSAVPAREGGARGGGAF